MTKRTNVTVLLTLIPAWIGIVIQLILNLVAAAVIGKYDSPLHAWIFDGPGDVFVATLWGTVAFAVVAIAILRWRRFL